MSSFDNLLTEYTSPTSPKIHGLITQCIDKTGTILQTKTSGSTSFPPSSAPPTPKTVLRLGSATKLLTTIALLQCIDRHLLTLDTPLTPHLLPELADAQILIRVDDDGGGGECSFAPRGTELTARHLLTHTSGLAYPFTHRLLMQRAQARARAGIPRSLRVVERYRVPVVFEPGEGWVYGCGVDWAGVLVSRLNGGVSLEEYMVENIWKVLGLEAPFPRFNIMNHPEYEARAMQGAAIGAEGGLEACEVWDFDNAVDQEGGAGLAATTEDFVRVLGDLVAEEPRLLGKGVVEEMFAPQLVPGSKSVEMLMELKIATDAVAGPISGDAANHGLGGMLCTGDVPEIGQPKGTLVWGGASNVIWWANRDLGVAGFFATQISPFGHPTVTKLVNAWKKDFWTNYNEKRGSQVD
ncbi:esterase [Corynespora cassiicola Philippines]|uniref:Esterase n=1 Tax=Corynespora cassiicola Philippines TaxID=1448308 RepID=A0A2T2P191_CORCC|nr:esterase [Corynespora cassiicola Philippines]